MVLIKYLIAVVFLVSSAASVYVFLNRGNLPNFELQSASLGEVYALPPSGPRMNGFSYKNKNLTVYIENIGNCDGWKITGPGEMNISMQGRYPTIPVIAGNHDYFIQPESCSQIIIKQPLLFKIDMKPQETVTANIVSSDTVHLISMPLVLSRRSGHNFTRWTPQPQDYGEQDIARARKFLTEHGITDSMNSLEKVSLIINALSGVMSHGNPPEYLNRLSPMDILDEAISGRTKTFCRQHALTQSFLSNVAGVPSRIVWSGQTIDGIMISGHGFIESYITEQSRWAYSDLTNEISYITDNNGNVLNAADVLSLISNNAGQGVTAWSSKLPEPTELSWGVVQKTLEQWFNKNTTILFWGGHDRSVQQIKLPFFKNIRYRVQRYLFEPTLYISYQHSYNLHWLRGTLMAISIFSGLALFSIFRVRANAQ